MKKRIICTLLSTAMLISLFSLNAIAASETYDEPSNQFIELYSEVFAGTDSYKIYDRQGNLITAEFIAEYYENYVNSDFLTIWNSVADNGYLLKYGTPSCQPSQHLSRTSNTLMYAYSERMYRLVELKQLLPGKMVEFNYRVVGSYISNGSTITAYYPPELELHMTDPGSLFFYTPNPQFTTTLNSTRTQITFDMILEIEFQYNYSEQIWQTIGEYYATAVGDA